MARLSDILTPEVLAKLQALDAAASRRAEAEDALSAASDECRALVVDLLRLGVPRAELVDRPFSSAWLSRIQAEEGLSKPRRKATEQ